VEPKVIIYIVIGILYFIYSISKKAQEQKESQNANQPPAPKSVSPPVAKPLQDIIREINRKQGEAEAKKKAATAAQKPILKSKQSSKEILVRQKEPTVLIEGSGYEPIYERELTEEEKIHRKSIQLQEDGVYHGKPEVAQTYEFDARQAFIGSVIFERKF
jgi:cell division protein FtsN